MESHTLDARMGRRISSKFDLDSCERVGLMQGWESELVAAEGFP